MSLGTALYAATLALLLLLGLLGWRISRLPADSVSGVLRLSTGIGAVMGAVFALGVFNVALQLGWLVAP